MRPERTERLYRFDPPDTSGVFLGLGGIQCALLGAGLLAGVGALTAEVPLGLAALPLVVATVACFARVGGYAAWEWLALGAGWLGLVLGRGRRWYPRLPLLTLDGEDRPAPLPPCLQGLSIREIPWRGRSGIGAVHDCERHTLTTAVRVSGHQFVVGRRADQERLLAGWGDVLNQFAVERGGVCHLAWSDLVAPSGLEEHLAWVHTEHPAGAPGGLRAAYDEVLDEATSAAAAHEVLVTITVSRDRLFRHRAGAGDPLAPLARAAASALEALLRGLRGADLAAGDPLTVSEWRRVLRRRIDPVGARPRPVGGRLVERLGLISAAGAGPLALEVHWRHVRVDGAYHRSYHVACWPRLAVPPAWLEPFLAAGGVTRTMTVTLAPVPAHRSRRRIERDLVKLDSDAATKEQKGRRVDARHRRATQSLLDREEELVAGYAEVGYAGLVTVSAASLDELDEHAEIVEQLAREAGMDLRCLDGRQDLAWAAALPLGLAPRSLLD
jgi:hypothetical protein